MATRKQKTAVRKGLKRRPRWSAALKVMPRSELLALWKAIPPADSMEDSYDNIERNFWAKIEAMHPGFYKQTKTIVE